MDMFVIAIMCVINALQAKSKNRKPIMFVIITIILMFGISVLMASIVLAVKRPDLVGNGLSTGNFVEVYSDIVGVISIPAFIGLAIGGVISFLIVRLSKPGESQNMQNQPWQNTPYGQNPNMPYGQEPNMPYGQNPYTQNPYTNQQSQNPYTQNQFGQNQYGQQAPYNPYTNPNGQMPYQGQGNSFTATWEDREEEEQLGKLQIPCTLRLIRENSQTGANELYTFSLNGHAVCRLGNGSEINLPVHTIDNTITARSGTGMSLKKPIHFQAVDGGFVEVYVKGDHFLPEKTTGKRPFEEV